MRDCMSLPAEPTLNFDSLITKITAAESWQYEPAELATCSDVRAATLTALSSPVDFPPIKAAILSGDEVALAVDPNTPQVAEVTKAVVEYLKDCSTASLSVVIGDEARPSTVDAIRAAVGDAAHTYLHDPSDRESLRYLGADQLANPIYLNRMLVDADFILPVTAGRWGDLDRPHDLYGIFPAFSDSASRYRFHQPSDSDELTKADPHEPAWLLGVQIMLCVTSNSAGLAAHVIAGATESVRKQLRQYQQLAESASSAPLVIASLDGNDQQQTWLNTARAALAAANRVDAGGTIVLWTKLDEAASGSLMNLSDNGSSREPFTEMSTDGEFPAWDPSFVPAEMLRKVSHEHRILLHSDLASDTIEGIGLGTISSSEELSNLTRSFASCGVLRAAPFSGPTNDLQFTSD